LAGAATAVPKAPRRNMARASDEGVWYWESMSEKKTHELKQILKEQKKLQPKHMTHWKITVGKKKKI